MMEEPWHEFVEVLPDTHVEVRIPPLSEELDYPVYDGDVRVLSVIKERQRPHGIVYKIRLVTGASDEVSFEELVNLRGGSAAIEQYDDLDARPSLSGNRHLRTMHQSSSNDRSKRKRESGFVGFEDISLSGGDSLSSVTRKRIRLRARNPYLANQNLDLSESDSDDELLKASGRRLRGQRSRKVGGYAEEYEFVELGSADESASDVSSNDSMGSTFARRGRKSKHRAIPTRRSDRTGRSHRNMRELYEDDIPEHNVPSNRVAPKFTVMKERFERLPSDDDFRHRHVLSCLTCGDYRENGERGCLVFCQSCTYAYHEGCLGSRNGRGHLVTKVSKTNFVLQCKRCIDYAVEKDVTAPHHSRCQTCGKSGQVTTPFRARKTPREEQREREENGGVDPITIVDLNVLDNPQNILFRCVQCDRAWHLHHLPPREENIFETDDPVRKAEQRWSDYSRDWLCLDCLSVPGRVGGLVAWRPRKAELFVAWMTPDGISEDDKEYLVKWDAMSYLHSLWKSGAWVWKMAAKATVIAFYKKNDGRVPPIMRTEDAIPEDYLRVDIVFKVEYNNIVADRLEEVDLARIREVERALVKYRGLSYEDVVWDKPPDPAQEPERWQDFKEAYDDWVRGQYVRLPPSSTLSSNLRKVRSQHFEEKVMLKEQPKSLTGGELMSYQLDGLNWLYYQWHHGQNAILADEMGLGKTIQVISFLLTLREKHHCWPFLVVVPNATVANWKREIKLWAPSLRVVTFFGSSRAIDLAEKYELFRENKKDLSCHVVVTSYEAAQTQSCQRVLRKIPWQALIVDEGQRLKSDKSILYNALSLMRSPFKLLLTGTPLQNNQRELFNLLHFLDPSINAEEMEQRYETLTNDNILELHNLLRPFFLRRTKAQVLDFLPTMAQIIVPVTMTGLQKQLYKTILSQNTDVLRSIFGGERRAPAKGGLRNLLMQLRKCLCHPFVYNLEIEERTHEKAVSHRRLVEASAKLQLLEIMLPLLRERGHRVLIFSQFLDMLTIMEDFLSDLGIEHSRLDGSMSSLQKQKCIDGFNAPDSKIFAFLLSTRAGGVGINLASADTVIIMDPDFNPHQDIQAISRAHRIGQKKKVLVFQIMTRMSAEEKIMQIGKKKMALDHALIDSMEADEEAVEDLEAVLRFGAEALFKNDDSADIRYDTQSIEKLLDRSQVEDTKTNEERSVESQFSFARVWQNESASMTEGLGNPEEELPAPQNVWDQILAERARKAAEEASLRAEKLGRGKRQRKDVVYHTGAEVTKEGASDSKSDTDFQGEESEDDSVDEEAENIPPGEVQDAKQLNAPTPKAKAKVLSPTQPKFKRARVAQVPVEPAPGARRCPACTKDHPVGSCPLKIAGPEECPLCGLAHFTYQRTCPHLQSETQVRAMLAALQSSPEPRQLVDRAKKLLQGIKGSIVQQKKRAAEHPPGAQNRASAGQPQSNVGPTSQPPIRHFPPGSAPPGQVHTYRAFQRPPGYKPAVPTTGPPTSHPPTHPPNAYQPVAYYPGWPHIPPPFKDGHQPQRPPAAGNGSHPPYGHAHPQMPHQHFQQHHMIHQYGAWNGSQPNGTQGP